MELGFQVGDLVQTTLGWMGIIVEQDTQTQTGQYWWRVYNGAEQRFRIVGEWELERIK